MRMSRGDRSSSASVKGLERVSFRLGDIAKRSPSMGGSEATSANATETEKILLSASGGIYDLRRQNLYVLPKNDPTKAPAVRPTDSLSRERGGDVESVQNPAFCSWRPILGWSFPFSKYVKRVFRSHPHKTDDEVEKRLNVSRNQRVDLTERNLEDFSMGVFNRDNVHSLERNEKVSEELESMHKPYFKASKCKQIISVLKLKRSPSSIASNTTKHATAQNIEEGQQDGPPLPPVLDDSKSGPTEALAAPLSGEKNDDEFRVPFRKLVKGVRRIRCPPQKTDDEDEKHLSESKYWEVHLKEQVMEDFSRGAINRDDVQSLEHYEKASEERESRRKPYLKSSKKMKRAQSNVPSEAVEYPTKTEHATKTGTAQNIEKDQQDGPALPPVLGDSKSGLTEALAAPPTDPLSGKKDEEYPVPFLKQAKVVLPSSPGKSDYEVEKRRRVIGRDNVHSIEQNEQAFEELESILGSIKRFSTVLYHEAADKRRSSRWR